MSMFEELMKHIASLSDHDHDHSKWVQVGTLDGAEIRRRKTLERRGAAYGNQVKILQKQAEAIVARSNVEAARWWAYLEKKHSLPPQGNFTITEDHRILMQPKSKKETPSHE